MRADRRLDLHGDVERGAPMTIEVDGRFVTAYEGETVAGASHFLPMERPDLAREAIFEMATG